MSFAKTPKKAVSLLLIVAMLSVLVAAIVPFVSTADGDEIQNFGYQAPKDYTMLDESTSLRFVFTIGHLDYDEVGFVFSKTNSTPTIANSAHKSVDTVYRSITADGDTVDAPEDRFWVAIKLTDIPQNYFDGPIYVRGYVTKDASTTYSETKEISVWGANAIEYLTKWDGDTWSSKPYCYKSKGKATSTFAIKDEVKNTRKGGKFFYPDASNDDLGNDLLFEFSFLYNSLHAGVTEEESKVLAVTYIEDYNLFNINLATGIITASERSGDSYVYPLSPAHPEISIGAYGWHRFGVRIHQEATNNDGVVNYTITATAYLDGVRILEVDKTTWVFSTYSDTENYRIDGRLFVAEDNGAGGLTYSNPENGLSKPLVNQAWIMNEAFWDNSSEMYLILQDVYMTCGQEFVQTVVPVMDPADRTYKTSSYTRDKTTYQRSFNAPVWYALPLTDPYVISSSMNETARTAYNTEHGVEWLNQKDLPAGIYIKKDVNSIKGSNHYYPTDGNPAGNDLLVEFSYLWNSTMTSKEPFTFAHGDGYDVLHVKGTLDAKERAGYTYTYITPTPGEIAANPSVKTPSIGEYGWHRIGIRYHQEAEIVAKVVQYTVIATLYVDGVEKISIDLSDCAVRFFEGKTVKGLLFTATIDPEDESKLIYSDLDTKKSYSVLQVEDFFNAGGTSCVFGDLYMTCGQDFIQQVEPAVSPVAAPFDLGDYDPAQMYYQLAD